LGKEKLRVAIIGLGKMGLLHSSILNVLPNAELVALCDRSAVILRFSKKIFGRAGVHVVRDIEELSGLDLDCVYVTTPIFSHSAVVKRVYLSGIARNLFVEKTLASSYGKSKELCELAQRFGGINMVGFMKRFSVTFRKAKDLLAQKSLGEVASFEGYAYSSDFLGINKDSKKVALRGGALRDSGCHVIDLALCFFGDLQVNSADPQPLTQQAQNSVCFSVRTLNGLKGKFSVSQSMENYRLPEMGLLIKGSRGVMKVNDDELDLKLNDGKSSTWYRHDLNDNVDFWLGEPVYFREDQYFIESILNGRNAEPSFQDASKVDQIIDQIECRDGNK
jgi:predicted dehydrogenase